VVFDETLRDTIPSPQGPPLLEDDDCDDDYEIVPNPIPQAPTTEIIDTIQDYPDEPVAPTRTMQLELERVARIAMAPRSRSEKAQAAKAFALNLEDEFASEVILLVVFEPSSYNHAMKSPERPLYRKAIESEYLSLTNNATWKLVTYLGTMKVIDSMWKLNSRGTRPET
jgi:hypothetical protein